MTRRPKSRLPPKLADPATERGPRLPKGPTRADRLKREHVAGRSNRFGCDEVVGIMRRLALGAPAPRLGLPPFGRIEMEHLEAAVSVTFRVRRNRPSTEKSVPMAARSTSSSWPAAISRWAFCASATTLCRMMPMPMLW